MTYNCEILLTKRLGWRQEIITAVWMQYSTKWLCRLYVHAIDTLIYTSRSIFVYIIYSCI